jgi:hypothetical protein
MTNQQLLISTLTSTDLPIPPGLVNKIEGRLRTWRRLRAKYQPDFNKITTDSHREGTALRRKPWRPTLQPILTDVRELRNEEDCEGYIFRPSEYASVGIMRLIGTVYLNNIDLAGQLPRPFISPDGSGGIRAEWNLGDRTVSLWHPSSADIRGYVYYSAGELHNADRNLSSSTLRKWLRWLVQA